MPGRVLIVDDRMTSRIDLLARLSPAAYDLIPSHDMKSALTAARKQLPDLILLAANLPKGEAYTLARSLRALPGGSCLAIAMIGDTSDRALRLAALEAGADAFLLTHMRADILLARVRNLLRRGGSDRELLLNETAQYGFGEPSQQAFASPGQITLIAPSVETGLQWRKRLLPLLRDRIDVLKADHALAELNASSQPDAIVIATDPDGRDGALRLLSDLRCRADTQRAAIILVQSQPDPEAAIMALDLGVDDLVDTGFDCVEMVLRLRRELARKAQSDRCRNALQDGLRLAATDPLTGLFNRRYAMAELQRILHDPAEVQAGFAILAMDLDRFKRINDTFGHGAGDAVLTEVSRRMSECVRAGDFLARIGGEEFLAVIRTCDATEAARTAERLRRMVSDQPVVISQNTSVEVTLSIGLVQCGADPTGTHSDPAQLINLADKALYAAKTEGRNQVCLHRHAA